MISEINFTAEGVTAFIAGQRIILLQNLATQKRSLSVLIQNRSTTSNFNNSNNHDDVRGVQAELVILKRRLFIVESKIMELERWRIEAGDSDTESGEVEVKERKGVLAKNFSRKIKLGREKGGEAVWI